MQQCTLFCTLSEGGNKKNLHQQSGLFSLRFRGYKVIISVQEIIFKYLSLNVQNIVYICIIIVTAFSFLKLSKTYLVFQNLMDSVGLYPPWTKIK